MEDSPVQTPANPVKLPSSRGETIAKIGTVVSAVMASACCWLPLVLLAVGVSGAGIATTLEAYRPYFMLVTFAFLGAAFYYTYRPKQAAANGGHACCGPEATEVKDCCATASKGRFNIMTLNKAMLWAVTVLAVEVDYRKGQAVVETEACCPVPRDAILAALEKAGYRGSFPEPGAGVGSSPCPYPHLSLFRRACPEWRGFKQL